MLPPQAGRLPPLSALATNTAIPRVEGYAYRSFDRQLAYIDGRLGDFLRPELWRAHSERQVYLSTLLNHPLGQGPALTVSALVPDLHHFRGSFGAKEVIPLFRDAAGLAPNVLPGFLDLLSTHFGFAVSEHDLAAYTYSLLAHPAFTDTFNRELEHRELRVPVTKDGPLFQAAVTIGERLIWLHTYASRFIAGSRRQGVVPHGSARNTVAVSAAAGKYPSKFEYDAATGQLFVGDGAFEPVSKEIFEFEVSGLKVVQSWLGYRMAAGKGRKSSDLDDIRPATWTHRFTAELLELLWVLEATLTGYPAQAALLSSILQSSLFLSSELPAVPDAARNAPTSLVQGSLI